MDVEQLFQELTTAQPLSLIDLPEGFGIYALWDHQGMIRYIGCTPKGTEGFRTRIYSKHATGSEGRSHKFTQAYCSGRMWRYCKKLHPKKAATEEARQNANSAKKLRNAFIRKHCNASFVSIPTQWLPAPYFKSLTSLEAQLQSMAPEGMRAWEGINFPAVAEPSTLVDALLAELPHYADGARIQESLFKTYVLGAAA